MLRDSIDEVILEREQHMAQAEHRRVKSILDVRPIYNWINSSTNSRIAPITNCFTSHMVDLQSINTNLRERFGTEQHPDDGLVSSISPTTAKPAKTLFPKN